MRVKPKIIVFVAFVTPSDGQKLSILLYTLKYIYQIWLLDGAANATKCCWFSASLNRNLWRTLFSLCSSVGQTNQSNVSHAYLLCKLVGALQQEFRKGESQSRKRERERILLLLLLALLMLKLYSWTFDVKNAEKMPSQYSKWKWEFRPMIPNRGAAQRCQGCRQIFFRLNLCRKLKKLRTTGLDHRIGVQQ